MLFFTRRHLILLLSSAPNQTLTATSSFLLCSALRGSLHNGSAPVLVPTSTDFGGTDCARRGDPAEPEWTKEKKNWISVLYVPYIQYNHLDIQDVLCLSMSIPSLSSSYPFSLSLLFLSHLSLLSSSYPFSLSFSPLLIPSLSISLFSPSLAR